MCFKKPFKGGKGRDISEFQVACYVALSTFVVEMVGSVSCWSFSVFDRLNKTQYSAVCVIRIRW